MSTPNRVEIDGVLYVPISQQTPALGVQSGIADGADAGPNEIRMLRELAAAETEAEGWRDALMGLTFGDLGFDPRAHAAAVTERIRGVESERTTAIVRAKNAESELKALRANIDSLGACCRQAGYAEKLAIELEAFATDYPDRHDGQRTLRSAAHLLRELGAVLGGAR